MQFELTMPLITMQNAMHLLVVLFRTEGKEFYMAKYIEGALSKVHTNFDYSDTHEEL